MNQPDPTTASLIGTLVTYDGSFGAITPLLAAECRCRACIAATGAPGEVLLVLLDPQDREPVLRHPRRASLSSVEGAA
ncbi:hypothetical protein O3Q52_36245 [Streptomyces sp. ActVer]|uniref:hypothetical protein n=1 Tax=Streptomyces sp. ActVer TaxID=3014558 RepID=UPI0022B3A38D|nr:hypothetical protein [Streptomyces sp. ActVer]MCZ4513506.1 hypothetical protein [Streptomyces sp. ActVer]